MFISADILCYYLTVTNNRKIGGAADALPVGQGK